MAGQECRTRADGLRECQQPDGRWLVVHRAAPAASAADAAAGTSGASGPSGLSAGILDAFGIGDVTAAPTGRITGALHEGGRIAMWIAIAFIAVAVMVLAGVAAYFLSPVIAALK